MKTACFVLVSFLLAGCSFTGANKERTQLQLREMQSRIFDTADTKMVLKATLGVLQDEGFMIENGSVELGFLKAIKEIDVENSGDIFAARLVKVFDDEKETRYSKNSVVHATINLVEYGKQTKVRVNFTNKIYDNKGAVMQVRQIEDSKYYQEFFSRLDKGIFLHKEKIP